MKKYFFICILLIIPFVFVYSQDENKSIKKSSNHVTIIQKEITCPDCQGFGWIFCLNSPMVQTRNNVLFGENSVSREQKVLYKMVCPYCGGKKTVFIEYKLDK